MISKYQQLLDYITDNNIIKPIEVNKIIKDSCYQYINLLHSSYLLERIDRGTYKKSEIFFKISLKELNILYKKMRNETFRLSYFRMKKLNNILK